VPRAAWAALAIVAVMAISLAFEPVRAVASSFLGLFRVEHIQVIEIDPDTVSNQFESASDFEALLADEMQFEEFGEPQEAADAAEASQLSGFSLRLPSALQDEPKFLVQPGSRASFTVDMELVSAVLQEIGRTDIRLPADLDGAKIEVEVPTGVMTLYGDCEVEPAPSSDPDAAPRPRRSGPLDCTTLMQLPSPTVSAPPGLDMTGIGEAYLQILGLTADEAGRMARKVDWTTTFVVPIPRYSVDYQDVQVDGVAGILLLQSYRRGYVLVWVKDGMMYALSGPGEPAAALEIAESLK